MPASVPRRSGDLRAKAEKSEKSLARNKARKVTAILDQLPRGNQRSRMEAGTALLLSPALATLPQPDLQTDVIYRRDNREQLAKLPAECIDLIYLDPPFFSNRQYEVIWGDEAEVRSFRDRWAGGIQVYIEWMRERLREIHRVLKPTGSVYLHCDPHASHYLKVMMDEVFGGRNFRNEIVWKRTSAHSSAKRYGPVHDIILFYSRGESPEWNPQFAPHGAAYLASHYKNRDSTGRQFTLSDLTASGVRNGSSGQPWRGFEPALKGNHWKFTIEGLERLDAEGRLYWPSKGGWPRYRRFLDEGKGTPLQDVWTDLDPVNAKARERVGYPTQKPQSLLARIITSSSREGDVVLDPFCGCGTTLVVADQLKRHWIGIDISPTACSLMYKRLVLNGAHPRYPLNMPTDVEALKALRPFEFQNWIIDRVTGRQANRKSGDMGIDGWTFFLHDPIQIKQSERVGRNVIDNFETAITRAGRTRGYLIAFSFTKNAREEVARARRSGLTIELLTVRDLLERQEWVMGRMGYTDPAAQLAAMPVFDSSRHSAEELIESEVSGAGLSS